LVLVRKKGKEGPIVFKRGKRKREKGSGKEPSRRKEGEKRRSNHPWERGGKGGKKSPRKKTYRKEKGVS